MTPPSWRQHHHYGVKKIQKKIQFKPPQKGFPVQISVRGKRGGGDLKGRILRVGGNDPVPICKISLDGLKIAV